MHPPLNLFSIGRAEIYTALRFLLLTPDFIIYSKNVIAKREQLRYNGNNYNLEKRAGDARE
ncbi:hypothetical protein CAGA_21470 [Caproiciproducens galactitolivorans]|uniref:Uncharacterized protein n=1 Tax=Caproiciproducens galactitolivorans TaxID=642589 RepID=A0A4Z0XWF3_9FIRM|nr:hypothetical protein CAGA_21470 [Caproiciproducens galactitolivorans]